MEDWQAYLYSFAIVLSSVMAIILWDQQFVISKNVAMQIKVATSSLIYRKVVLLFLNVECTSADKNRYYFLFDAN